MNFNFVAVLARLGANAAFRIINAARPPADYLFATFLPERNMPGYQAKSGTMTIRTTMAGLVGADSPYPPTGLIDSSDFTEQVAKIANRVTLTEMDQRQLQQMLLLMSGNTGAQDQLLGDTALNFLDKLVTQAHLDAAEYLRGMALTTGALDWTFNKKRLQVDYGVPTANKITAAVGANGYGGATSTWWADYRKARKALKGQVRAVMAHPDTLDMIASNDVNKVRVIAQDNVSGTMTIQRFVGNTEQLSPDARDRVTIVAYGAEGEVLDPANPGKSKSVPFLKPGKIVLLGNPIPTGFQVGQGAQPNATNELPLGYTHVGPTVEGGGQPGRWADLRVPDDAPWSLEGRGVTNVMPVIEAPEKIAILTTDVV